MTSRARTARPRILAVVVGLLMAAAIAEAGVRVLDAHPRIPPEGKRSAPQWMYVNDPVVGVRTAPSFEYADEKYTTNSLGFRDRERAPGPAPDGTLRLAVLGDSFAAGVGVDDAQHFAALLESALPGATRDAAPIEVWNLGIPHYGVEQSYLLLREHWEQVVPDVVVFALFEGNDPMDDRFGPGFSRVVDGHLARQGFVPWPASPFNVQRAAINRPDFAPGLPGDGPLYLHSHAYRRVLRSISAIREARASAWPWEMQPFDYEAFGAVPWLYMQPEPPPMAFAWEISTGALAEMAALVRQRGARLVVMSIPAKLTIDRGVLARGMERGWRFGWSGRAAIDPELPARRVAAAAERLGLPLVRPDRELRRALEADEEPYYLDDSHWTAVGHRAAALALGRELGRLGIGPGLDEDRLERGLLDLVPRGTAHRFFMGGFRPQIAWDRDPFGPGKGGAPGEGPGGPDGGPGDGGRAGPWGAPRPDGPGDTPFGPADGGESDGSDRGAKGGGPGSPGGKGAASEIVPRLVDPARLVPLLPAPPPGWACDEPRALVGPLGSPREEVWVARAELACRDPAGAPHVVMAVDSAIQPEIDMWWRGLAGSAVTGAVPRGMAPTSARLAVLVPDGEESLLAAVDREALDSLERALRPAPGSPVQHPTLVAGKTSPDRGRQSFLRDPVALVPSLAPAPPGWEMVDLVPMYRPHSFPVEVALSSEAETLFSSAQELWRDGEPWTSQVKAWYRGPEGSFELVVQDTGWDARLLRVRQARIEEAWSGPSDGRDEYGSTLRSWEGAALRGIRMCQEDVGLCKVTVPLADPGDPRAAIARYGVILMGPMAASDEAFAALLAGVRPPG